jgi:hypothetical protein
MTTEHQRTPEEEAFHRLLDEKWTLLSEYARELIGLAQDEAYKDNLIRTYQYYPPEYHMGMADMIRLAGKLGDQDREFVAEVGRAAAAAAWALDAEDERPAVHGYYDMVSGMITKALEPKTNREREEARVELWKDYADFADFERGIQRDPAQARQRSPVQAPLDIDDIPF